VVPGLAAGREVTATGVGSTAHFIFHFLIISVATFGERKE